MTATSFPGPLSIEGQKPTFLGPTSSTGGQAAIVDSNPDLAPSLIHGGIGIRDPRWLQRIGAGALAAGGYPNQDVGWYWSTAGMIVCDQAPSTKSNTNIAGNQGVTSGTAMTLATASTGITVLAAPLSLFVPLGAIIPAGAIVLDGNPGYVGGGTSGGFAFVDPTKGISRCVSVTAAAGATGGVIAITGYDWYGALVHQNITAVAGLTVAGLKSIKFIVSAVPAFTDLSHNYSIGTTDVFGFNVVAASFPYVTLLWAGSLITTNTGFTSAVTTTATALTGDVRGTFSVPTASNGTNSLQMFVGMSVANAVAANFPAYQNGIIGVVQF